MSEDFFDAYAVLRVSRDVDTGGVRAMHRELAKRHHPDRGGTAADAEAMGRINRARDVLLDRDARATLDAELARREREAERSKAAMPSSTPAREADEAAGEWVDDWGQEVAWAPSAAPAPGPYRDDYSGHDGYPDYVTAPPAPTAYQTWSRPVRRPLDGVSLASFVLALTLGLGFGGPLALTLAVIGLVRTAGRKRRGRWAAVWGGILGTISTVWLTLTLIETMTRSA